MNDAHHNSMVPDIRKRWHQAVYSVIQLYCDRCQKDVQAEVKLSGTICPMCRVGLTRLK